MANKNTKNKLRALRKSNPALFKRVSHPKTSDGKFKRGKVACLTYKDVSRVEEEPSPGS